MAGIYSHPDDERLNIQYDEQVGGLPPHEEKERIDGLITAVREKHHQLQIPVGGTEERERLLNHYRQLPHDRSEDQSRFSDRHGEILVTFYTHALRIEGLPDAEDDSENESPFGDRRASRVSRPSYPNIHEISDEDLSSSDDAAIKRAEARKKQKRRTKPKDYDEPAPVEEGEKPTYFAVPLQYLCNLGVPGAPAIDARRIPLLPEYDGRLRIIEFPTQYFAAEFLDAMKSRETESADIRAAMEHISLDRLINNRKVSINKLKISEDKKSMFITGVSYHRNMPKNKPVSYGTRRSHRPGTVLFVAIPYLGLEPVSRAEFRNRSLPVSEPSLELEDHTAYHLVDNPASSRFSSLSLLQYNFPNKTPNTVPTEFPRGEDPTEEPKGECLVVHQVWFMVFDDGNIAAFRSANDIQPQHAPLFPQNYQSFGAYHALANMIEDILPSWEVGMLDMFSRKVSEFELAVFDGEPDNPRLKTMKTELSTIVKIVGKQIEILKNLRSFHLEAQKEQFNVMRKAIDRLVKQRDSFRKNIQGILGHLNNVQTDQHHGFEVQRMVKEVKRESIVQKQQESQETFQKHMIETTRKQEEFQTQMVEFQTQILVTAQQQNGIVQEQQGIQTKLLRAQRDATKALEQQNQMEVEVQEALNTKTSIFTFVTALFLPLSFLTSYFGMNIKSFKDNDGPKDPNGNILNEKIFWLDYCIPLTALILFSVMFQNLIMRYVRRFISWVKAVFIKRIKDPWRINIKNPCKDYIKGKLGVKVKGANDTRDLSDPVSSAERGEKDAVELADSVSGISLG